MLPYIALLAVAGLVAWSVFRGLINSAILMFDIQRSGPRRRMLATAAFTVPFLSFLTAMWFGMGGDAVLVRTQLRSAVLFGLLAICAGVIVISPLLMKVTLRCTPRQAMLGGWFVSFGFAVIIHIVAYALLLWKGY